ncbi:MAG: GNAT family N-acetyltransferase [Chloroflexota bacterium]
MITFRRAEASDAPQIAKLHATSWRNSYRGMLSDRFLDEEVVADRLAVWQKRLHNPPPSQFVLLAERDQMLLGFLGLFAAAHPRWGALLDNLHVRQEAQGQGLGKRLMQETVVWIEANYPDAGLYLWVFASNGQAIRFYEKLGGRLVDEKVETEFGEKPVRSLRYVWEPKIDNGRFK